jgi:hypothetical protein
MKHKYVRLCGIAAMLLAHPAFAQAPIVLEQPLDWQVIQRNAQDWAEIKVEGTAPAVKEPQGKLKRFAIAGDDKMCAWGDAVIDGKTVVVSSPEVPNPVAIRYAYTMSGDACNLYNNEGLPASPFRTDDWEK